jgi:peptidoglycan-associated lipoprotein
MGGLRGIILMIMLMFILGGCATKSYVNEKATEIANVVAEDVWMKHEQARLREMENTKAILDKEITDRIFFDTASYALTEQAKSILNKKFELLKKYPNAKLMIYGNCDIRGTAEYNLALGFRRAEVVKGYLVRLGITPDRLFPVSFGKERQIDKKNYSINRRDEFAVTIN